MSVEKGGPVASEDVTQEIQAAQEPVSWTPDARDAAILEARLSQLENSNAALLVRLKALEDGTARGQALTLKRNEDLAYELACRIEALNRRIDPIAPLPPAAPSPLEEFKRPKPVEWPFAWHGRPDNPPSSLPPGAPVYDRREAITRAKWGYDREGRRVRFGKDLGDAWNAVEQIRAVFAPGVTLTMHPAHLAVRERFEGVDPEFACFGTLVGLWAPTKDRELDGEKTPADYRGVTIDSYLASLSGAPVVEEMP